MIVVADTGPLNYLVRLGYIEMLPQLYDRIIIPYTVLAELRHPNAPPQVYSWASYPPAWLEISHVETLHPDLSTELDPGEYEAISLALYLRPPTLLIDESFGRKEAQRLGLKVKGTLSVLIDLSLIHGFSLADALVALRECGFYLSASLEAETLAQYRRRE